MKVYTAGKIWHAHKFQALRDILGFNINARWIDYDSDHPVVQDKATLWQHCYEDVVSSDYVFLYSENGNEEHRGALVEVGMAFGAGIPVYAAGQSQSTKACAISDVAFTYFENWHWLQHTDLVEAYFEALNAHTLSQIKAKKAV